MSSAYHPQTDEQTKVVSLCLELYLHCFVGPIPDVGSVLTFGRITCYHLSSKMTLFDAFHPPPALPKYFGDSTAVQEVENQLLNCD